MSTMANPLRSDLSITVARERVVAGELGQRLAVYAAARARHHLDDPLIVLGLPLIDEIVTTLGEVPVSVTAVSTGGPARLELWTLLLSFPSELRATIDVGTGLGHAQPGELDLRIEWTGAERAILVEPTAVAVTVANVHGQRRESAEVTPIAVALFGFAERAREIIAEPPIEWRIAAAVIAAARESSATRERGLIRTE